MPMGYLNTDSTFVATRMKPQMEWDTLSKEGSMKMLHKSVNYVLLYECSDKKLLVYFITLLDFLKQQCAKRKLKRWKWFQYRCGFLGMRMASGGA